MFMKPLISIVTALHVLAHGLFGCCDHAVAAKPAAPHCCHCQHAHASPPRAATEAAELAEHETPTRSQHECVHDSCHWLVGDAGLKFHLAEYSLLAYCITADMDTATATHAEWLRPDSKVGAFFAPPVRLHLALGVILV
jgi:hypothetical protein